MCDPSGKIKDVGRSTQHPRPIACKGATILDGILDQGCVVLTSCVLCTFTRFVFVKSFFADAVAVLLNPAKMSLAYFGHLLVFCQISTVFLLSSSSWARFIMFGPRRGLEELCNVIIYARRASLRVFR